MKNFLTLKEFFIKNKWRYFFGVIALLVVDIVQLIVPQILRSLTNLLQNNSLTISRLTRYGFYIILTGIGIGLGRYFWRILIQGASRDLEYYLRNKFFKHLQSLSTNYFNTHKTGDLMAHATNDINAVRMALGQGVVLITDSIFITITALIFMVNTANLKLTVLALLPLPFLTFMVSKFSKLLHKRFKNVQEAFSELTDNTQESFAGIRVIKSFVQEEAEIDKFAKSNKNNFKKNIKLAKIMGLFFPLIRFISAVSFLIVIWYGGILVISGEITLGDFVAFNLYMDLLVWPMMAIGFVINVMQRGSASMERLNKILDEKPEIYDSEDVLAKNEIMGDIEFKNLSFKYPNSNEYALKNINLKIPKGSTLAIIGRTGSGKTTLVNLLLRLHNVTEGNILIDGLDISKVPLKTLRENIGFVPQENFLFSTSIKENIALAFDNKVCDEEVIKASKVSQVYDNIMEFKDKFETISGERGVTLSGGQKQRVSISRAIIKNPSILILDDSLSAVDTHTEEKILQELNWIMKSRTSIIIAHRISTIKNANNIIVVDEGKIVQSGTHEELFNINGIYKNIYDKQLLEEKLESIKEG